VQLLSLGVQGNDVVGLPPHIESTVDTTVIDAYWVLRALGPFAGDELDSSSA
jgi:hypothetical protein